MSEFEKAAMEARKQTMRKPGHRASVPFGTTGMRFAQGDKGGGGAAPGAYEFVGTMASEVSTTKTRARASPGSTGQRQQRLRCGCTFTSHPDGIFSALASLPPSLRSRPRC
jgi:hypothetical protein